MTRTCRSISVLSCLLANLLLVLAAATGAQAQDLVISGVIDGPRPGGVPKAIEIYVINDVPDLSAYGVASANNGAASPGAPEFVFPAVAVSAGSYVYVASEAPEFTAFFGFAPDFADTNALAINGDDAIELYEGSTVIDVFGEVGVDGTGQPWEYLDGWAYRVSETGPDGSVFDLTGWTFSGTNALDGESTNATAATPFPTGTFTRSPGADLAPRVLATTPSAGASNVAIDADIEIVFSEPVTVSGTWFELACSTSGNRSASPSTADNTTFNLLVDGSFAEGESCTLTILAAGVSDVDAIDPPDTMAADFELTFSAGAAGIAGVIINEFLADPPSGLAGDANGDGIRDGSQDEFLEIYNDTGADLDISGWTIADAVGVRHTFPGGSVVSAGCSIVVFGGGTPTGSFGGGPVQTASSGLLGFNNGGDSITLSDASGVEAASTSYGAEGGANQSLTRSPDLTGDFAQHSTVSSLLFSPGTKLDGAAFDGCPAPLPLKIYDVQGNGAETPFRDQFVVVNGIVTGDFQAGDADTQSSLNGFYLQDQDGDGDATTSDGIFVFDGFSPDVDVNVGDALEVIGTATEFFGETQISMSSVRIVSTGNSVPAATAVSLPAADVLFVGGQYLPDLERYEGMLVTFPDTLYATDLFNLDRFGEIQLITKGVPSQFTNFAEPDAAGFDAHLRDIGSRTIMLDDGLTVQNPDPIRYPEPGLPNDLGAIVRTGDIVSNLTGNLRWSRGAGGSGDAFYRLMPTTEPVFVSNNPRPASTPAVGGTLKVASFNVLNFFTTIDNPGNRCGPNALRCRGADSDEEYQRQLAKIVSAIVELDADILGLIELENSDGVTLPTLVAAINAVVGADTYDYVDTGFIGTDAIKVGFIYDTTTVVTTGPFAVLDSSVDGRFIDTKNRPVLAQTFSEIATAGIVTVAVNHLKSKGSACDDVGDPDAGNGQGNCNGTRTLAAQATVDWLATDPTMSGDDDVLVIGDFNAYLMEDPIEVYKEAGFDNPVVNFVGPDPYTFLFSQQRGALDHALASATLASQVTGAGIWHANTDEADALDYNLDFGRNPAIFSPDPFRASDHDAVLVGLELEGDLDRDGVPNADDQCPATVIPESVPTVGTRPNRYALTDGDLVFDAPRATPGRVYTTVDTAGCSCEQIVEATGAGKGHLKFGCSKSLLEGWIQSVGN